MALEDEVKSRVASQDLIELTNGGDPDASSVNDTVLGKAADDIEAKFELYASENFDSTNKVHIAICVPAVLGKLKQYAGRVPSAEEQYGVFIAEAEKIAENNIPGPASNSNYNQKAEREKTTDKFRFTRSMSEDYIPRRRGSD